MDGQIDKFVSGLVGYAISLLRALFITLAGVVRLRPLRTAIKLKILHQSRDEFAVSGRAFLAISCIAAINTGLEREDFFGTAQHIFNSDITWKVKLVSSAILVIFFEIAILFVLRAPQFMRSRDRRQARRRYVQRTEILRYFVGISVILAMLPVLFFALLTQGIVERMGVPPLYVAILLFLFFLLISPLKLIFIYPALAQIPKTFPKSRLRYIQEVYKFTSRLFAPLVFFYAVWTGFVVQRELSRSLTPTHEAIRLTDVSCSLRAADTLVLHGVIYNPSDSWYVVDRATNLRLHHNVVDPKTGDPVYTFKSSTKVDGGGNSEFPVVIDGGDASGAITVAPKSTQLISAVLTDKELVGVVRAAAGKTIYCSWRGGRQLELWSRADGPGKPGAELDVSAVAAPAQ